MDELVPGTIRVKHKLLSFLPYVIINESDFDPEMHSLYEEAESAVVEELPTASPEPEPEVETSPPAEAPTGKKGTKS